MAVRQAMLNYIDAFYQNDEELARESIWEGISKHGYGRRASGDPYQGPFYMTWEDLLEHVAGYRSNDPVGPGAPRSVSVFEVSDKTASGKLEADWGFDYVHLSKIDGTWKVVNVLWQTYPNPNEVAED